MVRKRIIHHTDPPARTQSSDNPPPSIASEEVEELPAEIFTDPVDITKSKHLRKIIKISI